MRHARFFALTALLCAIGLPLAHATVLVEVPLEELVSTSDAIVHARVLRTGSRIVLEEGGGMTPHTITELQVIEWLSGSVSQTTVTVDELGGTYPGGGMTIDGTPTYRAGDEVVVFLSRVEGRWRTRGMVQGLFVVRPGVPGTEAIVVRDTSGVGFARWEGGPMTVDHGGREEMPLASFLTWIRSTVEQLDTVPGGSGTVGGGL